MIRKMNIISVPDERLRTVSKEVTVLKKDIFSLVERMSKTLVKHDDPPGVGLSAVQVGEHKRIFLTYLPKDDDPEPEDWNEDTLELKVFINPVITEASDELILGGTKDKPFMEGCLSMPNVYGPVKRHSWVTLMFDTFPVDNRSFKVLDTAVKKVEKKFADFPARVIQHEQDHLDGILFTDRTIRQGLQVFKEVRGEFEPIELG